MSKGTFMFPAGTGSGNTRPECSGHIEVWGNDAAWLDTGNRFTITSVNGTLTLDNVGNRPCKKVATAGAVTDGSQYQSVDDSILLTTVGNEYLIKFSFRTTVANKDIAVGAAVIDTTIIGSDPTEFVMVRQHYNTDSETRLSLRTRRNSGTAVSVPIGPALAADTWYDGAILLKKDSSTAGYGRVTVWLGDSVALGGTIPMIYDAAVAGSFPDLANLAAFGAFLAGTASASCYWHYFGTFVKAQ